MGIVTDALARLRSLLFRSSEERELEEELSFHFDREVERQLASGVDEREARRRARLVIGGTDRVTESFRDARGVRPMEDLVRDVRQGARVLSRNPGFAAIAILVLGLGVGSSVAMFSAVNAVILEPLPFRDPGSLYMLWESNPEKGWEQQVAAPANLLDWRERVEAFEQVGGYTSFPINGVLTGRGEPQVLKAIDVTGNFFSMLGVSPALGRTFTDAETWDDSEHVILLSWNAYQSRFGGDAGVLNTLVTIDGTEKRVVGVMPEGFAFPVENIDYWSTMRWARADVTADYFRRAHWVSPIARLKRGFTAEQADAQLKAVMTQLEREHPVINKLMGAGMTPLQEFLLGDTRTPMLVLLAAVGVLLLVASANVGNLLLVKASGRRHELAVRAALGARSGRMVRQILTESAVLAGAGGVLGLAVGWVGTRLLEAVQPAGLLRVSSFEMDGRVLAFSLAVSMGAALLFGCLPALFAGRANAADTLRETGRSRGPGRTAQRSAAAFVVAQIALAVMLVTGAGLLVRSVLELQRVDPGFDGDQVLAVTLNLPGASYAPGEPIVNFYDQLLERVQALPGVASASATSDLPIRERGFTSGFFVAGRAPDDYGSEIVRRRVMPGYFEAMRVPLLRGRTFTAADREGSEPVAIINEAMAREWFGDADPIGQRITTDIHPDTSSIWRTIVGVVGSERQSAVALAPQIEMFESFYQARSRRMSVVVRTSGEPESLVEPIRAVVSELDPNLPLYSAVAMSDVIADSTARQRFLALLLGVFATLALVLALVGVYGVTAQAARNRRQEIGVRLALGAGARDILRLSLARGAGLTMAGVAAGILGALIASRAMEAMVFNVPTTDPWTYGGVAVLLAVAGVAASWIPAWSASRLDPVAVLRND